MELELSELGKAIESRRNHLHLSKTQVIKATRISPNSYYRLITSDVGSISIGTMTNVARALGLSLTALLMNDPAYGSKQDYFYNKRAFYEALDLYIDMKLHELNAPVQIPIYERVFIAMLRGASQDPGKRVTTIPVPDEISTKPGYLFGTQVIGQMGKTHSSKQAPMYAILHYDKVKNFKPGIPDGKLLCITNKLKADHIGHCFWDHVKAKVRIEKFMHGQPVVEIEYPDITYVCEVLMLIYS